jgi:hypothetical protein
MPHHGTYSLLGGRRATRTKGLPVFRVRPTSYQMSATASAITTVTTPARTGDKKTQATATTTAAAAVLPIARRRHLETRSSRLIAFHRAARCVRRSFTPTFFRQELLSALPVRQD